MEEKMEETISLAEIMETIKKRIAMIILITLGASALSGIVSYFFLTPIYQASSQVLVNQTSNEKQGSLTTGQIRANLNIINTYQVIIKSPYVLDKVTQQIDTNLTSGQLSHKLTVSAKENSQVLKIAVKNEDPAQAVQLANTIAHVFQDEIISLMNVDNVTILSSAELSEHPSPISPNPKLNMAIAFVIGLMISIGLAFLLEYLDTSIKTERDVEELLGLPVLGSVAEMSDKEVHSLSTRNKSTSRQARRESIEP